MVDCEPSGGDVYKMFLGNLLKDMDEKLNITNVLSPSSPSLSRVPPVRNGNSVLTRTTMDRSSRGLGYLYKGFALHR